MRPGPRENDRVALLYYLDLFLIVPTAAQVISLEIVRGISQPLGDELPVLLV